MNAIFEQTSAAKNIGIDQLFHNLGCKYIDPNYKTEGSSKKVENKPKAEIEDKNEKNSNKKIKLDEKKLKQDNNKNKKKCCENFDKISLYIKYFYF